MSESDARMTAELYAAVHAAITKVGIDVFRATSLFGSNERQSLKKAA